ncbi:chemotaxis protein CheW [Deferribacterales bacterium Es71-Z0220]|uniref:chemotaxis protein CheW n=1 Tax=Deferrivibrio essentukiensis TaxID=2880922 RepID=UPI001F61DCEA|nr:chemotaxis protein CheW [Deferrivibrio essentukiensis]
MIKQVLLKKAKGLPVVEKPVGLKKFVVCMVGSKKFLIELDKVRELVPLTTIANIPGTDHKILGALYLRGEIVVIIDLREKLNVSEVKKTIASRFVIVDVEGELLGIFVDEAQQIIEVGKEQIAKEVEEKEDFFYEYVDVDGLLVGVLDLSKIYFDYKIK